MYNCARGRSFKLGVDTKWVGRIMCGLVASNTHNRVKIHRFRFGLIIAVFDKYFLRGQ